MVHHALVIDPRDSVAVALADLAPGQECTVRTGAATRAVAIVERVPFGHKFAIDRIPAGTGVLKYGEVIGESTCDIEPGAWVHLHNLASSRGHERRGGQQ